MLKYGFYDAVNRDRAYDAEDMGRLFEGIITDGVFAAVGDKFFVSPDDSTAESFGVIVGTGRAWFDGTWTNNDAPIKLPLEYNSEIDPRYDYICLKIDKRQSGRINSVEVYQRSLPATTENVYIHVLAQVTVPSRATVIQDHDILQYVGTSTPFVTSPIQSIDTSEYVDGWINAINQAIEDAISNYFEDGASLKPEFLGGGYAECTTAAGVTLKTVTIPDFRPANGGIFCIRFINSVPANSSLNISDGSRWTGAKEIRYQNAPISTGVINANRTAAFLYDTTADVYRLVSVDDDQTGGGGGGTGNIDNIVYGTVNRGRADINSATVYDMLSHYGNILFCLKDAVSKNVAVMGKTPESASDTVKFYTVDEVNNQIIVYELDSANNVLMNFLPLGGGGGSADAVTYSAQTGKTDEQKAQARTNIGALSINDSARILNMNVNGSSVTLGMMPSELIDLCGSQAKVYFMGSLIAFTPTKIDVENGALTLSAAADGVYYEVTLTPSSSTTMSGTLISKPLLTEPTVVTLTGSTPVIAEAQDNTVYKCSSEVTSLTVQSVASGASFSLKFISPAGTATVLTMPASVYMPSGFTVEPYGRCEINVDEDGYAAAMFWPFDG